MSRVSAIVLAGGKGTRFGSSIPKPFMSLNGRKVIDYSLDALSLHCDEIIVVSEEPHGRYLHAAPGVSRSESVKNGLALVTSDFVIVHDAVRPYVTRKQVSDVIDCLLVGAESVDTAVPIVDGFLEYTSLRGLVPKSKAGRYLGQTPEGFRTETLRRAFDAAEEPYQDEVTMVYHLLNIVPTVVDGSYVNSKLTFEQDLSDAEGILKFRQEPISRVPFPVKTLVLGGTGGIGRAIEQRINSQGELLAWVTGKDAIDLSRWFEFDLSPWKAVVHAAGTFGEDEMEVNFFSCVRLVEMAEEQGWEGNMVFLSSTAATYGRNGYAMYSASKAALNAYIEARHNELATKGIRINAIAPAKTDTPLQQRLNPGVSKNELIDPAWVAEYVLRYTDTDTHGHIIYLRKGLDH